MSTVPTPTKMAPVVRPYIAVNKIESSMIQGFGYDANAKVLRVTFKGRDGAVGTSYDYEGVPPELHANLQTAESAGKFINTHIARKFKTHKLESTK